MRRLHRGVRCLSARAARPDGCVDQDAAAPARLHRAQHEYDRAGHRDDSPGNDNVEPDELHEYDDIDAVEFIVEQFDDLDVDASDEPDDGDEMTHGGGGHQRMEHLVVPEDLGNRVRPFRRVDDCADRIEDTTADDESRVGRVERSQ